MGSYDGVELDDLHLHGERLTLRPWRHSDADAVHRVMQDPNMHVFLNLPDPYTREDALNFVAGPGDEGRGDGTGIGCAVAEAATGRLVGSAALRLPRGPRVAAEIGYWTDPRAQGNGYAAEASRVLAGWAFGHGVTRVEILCAATNVASVRTALRAGFCFEAVLRADGSAGGAPVDHAVFARLAQDPGEPVPPRFAPLPHDGLGDGTIALRILDPADTAALIEAERDPQSVATGFGTPLEATELAARAARARLEWLVGPVARMALVDVTTGRFAGSLQLRLPGPPGIADLGYTVHPDFRGRGYAARALRLIAAWAFTDGGFRRLELGAKAGNVASRKSALAAGFEPDGVHVARLRNPDGSYADEHCFCRLAPR